MNASAKRLLVVDDALIMRAIIKDAARQAGWEIVGEAATGSEAVAKFDELQPDLTTLDIVMPEMDGVEALRVIRREHPDARIVMITAIDQRAKLEECIRLGAIDFVSNRLRKIACCPCFPVTFPRNRARERFGCGRCGCHLQVRFGAIEPGRLDSCRTGCYRFTILR